MYPSNRRSKPWPGVGIDITNPIAQGLRVCIPFNEGSGSPYETFYAIKPSSVAHLSWGSGVDGNVATFNGTNSTITYPVPTWTSTTGLTALVRCSFATMSGTQTLYKGYGSSQTCALTLASGSLQVAGSNTARVSWTVTGINAGEYHTYVAVDSPTGGNGLIYTDGVKTVTSTSGTGSVGTLSGNLYVGSTQIASNLFNGSLALLLIWNRVLSPQEIIQVTANPWQIFQPAWPRGRIVKPASSFLITEYNLPAHLSTGSVTVHAVGTNTTWNSGTTFSCSGVPGWSVVSQDGRR